MKFKRNAITIFLFINTIHAIVNNMVHPVTPTFIHSLKLGDAVFGLAFAAMAFTNFLLSFFWGNWVNRFPIRNIFIISLSGYILGQFLFMNSTTTFQIILARLVAGCFIAGFQVGGMAYIINQSEQESRAHYLTFYSISNIVAATLGFLIGGQLGNISVRLTFIGQLILLGVVMLSFGVLMTKHPMTQGTKPEQQSLLELVKNSKDLFNPILISLLITAFFISSGNIVFDQSFNYYIKDVFNFLPSHNGYLKVIIGIVTLLANVFLTFRIIKRGRLSLSLACLAFGASLCALLSVLSQQMLLFIIFALGYLSVMAVIMPLEQQVISMTQNDGQKSNQVMGIYNAIRALGMISGALLSSVFYSLNPKGPFMVGCVLFLVVAILYYRLDRKETR